MKKLLIPFLLILLLPACRTVNPRYINAPNIYSPTYFTQKGDKKISVSGTFGSETSEKIDNSGKNESTTHWGVSGQGAYALSNKFYVKLGGYLYRDKDKFAFNDMILDRTNFIAVATPTPTTMKYKRSAVEAGLGYFVPITDSKVLYFSPSMTASFGKFASSLFDRENTSKQPYFFDASFQKVTISPEFQFFITPYVRASFDVKYALMRYKNTSSSYPDGDEARLSLDWLTHRKILGFFEPSMNLQFGFKKADWLKLDLGMHFATNPHAFSELKYTPAGTPSGTNNIRISDDPDYLRSRNAYISIGFSIYP